MVGIFIFVLCVLISKLIFFFIAEKYSPLDFFHRTYFCLCVVSNSGLYRIRLS